MVKFVLHNRRSWWAAARSHFTWKRILGFCAVAFIISFFCFTLFIAWLTRDLPDPDRLQDRVVIESTKMFDRTGTHLLYELFDQKKRTVVDIAGLPPYVVKATLAIEDPHFYEHKGIRWVSLVRALVSDALHLSSGRGGASTITQQLVKNAILSNEHSLTRKIKEGILALQIERQFSKDQILKLYFNEIPYGSTNYGIESASQAYYGKSAKDLSLPESATLAAMPQAPTHYLQDPDMLRKRRDVVLTKMQEFGYITAVEMAAAKATSTPVRATQSSTIAPHYVMYLKSQLVDQFGEKTVDEGGLKVITTLDYDLQIAANTAIKSGVDAAEKKYDATNGALLSMDPKTGEILAMVGSRDFFDDKRGGQFNVVTQGLRQPGSSFKPIVYSAAFEKGFPTETVLFDSETDFPYDGRIYHPHNYDGKEHGPVTMHQALQGSLNIPAVKTMFLVGIDRALDFADRLGYTTFKDRSQFGPSVVLGGGGVKMIEHVRAYAAFANGGQLVEPVGILKIEDRTGADITPKRTEPKQVLTSEIAATISNVLSDNAARAFVFGAKNHLTLSDRPVAVKTGTTNDYHDAWTVGYTPQIVTGVWVGNNDNHQMKGGADGSIVAAPIWQEFMVAATKKLPVVGFPAPLPGTASNVMMQGLTNGGIKVVIDTVSGKLATEDTPPETTEARTYIPAHDILYYVNPDDPLGPSPTDPTQNAQYAAWEAGAQKWIVGHTNGSMVFGAPPTESDDVHKKELRPSLSILNIKDGTILSTTDFTIQVDTNAPRGVSKVEYRIDGTFVGVVMSAPFALAYANAGLAIGTHALKVTAYDDVGNATTDEVSFIYQPNTPADATP